MKKVFINIIIAFLFFPFGMNAQHTDVKQTKERCVERIFMITDRDAYIAGESIWISVFCFDITGDKGAMSGVSSVAYLELQNESGLVSTAKIYVDNGRGGGRIEIPPVAPTGNYKIVGYTRNMRNEEHLNYNSKVISIFNTLSIDRVKGNVIFTTGTGNKEQENDFHINTKTGNIIIESENECGTNKECEFRIKNISSKKLSLAVSVARIDNLPVQNNEIFASFIASNTWNNKSIKFTGDLLPDFEGELVEARVTKQNGASLDQYIAYLSAIGKTPYRYSSYIDSTGKVMFFTTSIFGDRERVVDVPFADTLSTAQITIIDPFIRPQTGNFPKLIMDESYKNALNNRSIEMQLGKRFGIDTMYDRIKIQKDPLLHSRPKVYLLDDYTRFPVMSEVMVEYIPELRFRKVDKNIDLEVRISDYFNSLTFSKATSLALLDGIPVFNHKRIYDYDPLKVKSISIYMDEYYVGATSFQGLVMFDTYKGDYPGLKLDVNARIFDYQGVQYPSRFTGKKIASRMDLPDLRSLLYWDPVVEIEPGREAVIKFTTSASAGKFAIRAEGVGSDGQAASSVRVINVK